jgi:DNA helicase HerA-like ATPase
MKNLGLNTEEISKECFVGLILQPESDESFTFLVNNDIKININQFVYIKKNDDLSTLIIAQVKTINTKYFVNETEKYFLSFAAKNNLYQLTDTEMSPKNGSYIVADILGHFKSMDGSLTHQSNCINRYTPRPLEKVYSLDPQSALAVFNLTDRTNDIELGQIMYPVYLGAFFKPSTFNKHTLIAGVTGSGKSRLVTLLIKQLLKHSSHITILDPHNEYINFFGDEKDCEIYHFSRNAHQKSKERGNNHLIKFRNLQFYEDDISPAILSNLLPYVSPQQEEKIFYVYDKIIEAIYEPNGFYSQKKIDKKIKIKDYINFITDLMIKEDANENQKLGRREVGLADVYMALINKIKDLSKEKIFVEKPNLINWLDYNPPSLDILNIDFSTDEFNRRYVNTVLQCFLNITRSERNKILIIDEVHLLLNNKESQTFKNICRLLRESRRNNTTVVFVTQNKSDIPPEIITQFHNTFLFRESDNDLTNDLEDQVCSVNLYGSLADFILRVKEIKSLNEIRY